VLLWHYAPERTAHTERKGFLLFANTHIMKKEEFVQILKDKGFDLSEKQIVQFEQYLHLLQEWNEKMNLTAITKEEEIWEKHFYDSAAAFLDMPFENMCDVGSGAGFPGIPVAILYPERKVTLVEPLQKRCRFLQEVKDKLQLDNLQIENERAEDFAAKKREQFDLVSARAVARLSLLLELCIPLLDPKGTFIALKGRNGYEELEQAKPAIDALKVHLKKAQEFNLEDDAGRINFYFEKEGKTDPKYPRPYGIMKKKPLELKKPA
jgi:16S rRNA (guanine527-N7)-methyltransferase